MYDETLNGMDSLQVTLSPPARSVLRHTDRAAFSRKAQEIDMEGLIVVVPYSCWFFGPWESRPTWESLTVVNDLPLL